jgi:two-component system NtrC family sensor kinase
MGDSGNLSVKTFVQQINADFAGHNPASESVVVQIEDTGSGIAGDKLDKLFEPFFTTKPVGSGTGLGLSVSKNIVELHEGTIKIANRTEIRGVAVTIMFPVPNRS